MADPINEVLNHIRQARPDYTVTLEHPGCVVISERHPLETSLAFWAGTANPTWCVDLVCTSTGEVFDSWNTGIPSHSKNYPAIAQAIIAIVERECVS